MIITLLDHNTPPHLPRKVSAQTGKPLEPAQCRASKIGEIAQNNRHNRHNWPILRHLWMGGGCLSDKQTEKRKNSGCAKVRTTSIAEDRDLSVLTFKLSPPAFKVVSTKVYLLFMNISFYTFVRQRLILMPP